MADSTGEMTRIVPADADGIAEAVELLEAGGIAAIPTETVYGLAADAANGVAVAAVYAAKGRPAFNPLIVHVADRAMAGRYAGFEPLAEQLADAFWPGPLTLVLPLVTGAPLAGLVTAGLPTVALRVPAHPAMQGVVQALGRGVAAPSANASGQLSPTRAGHVLQSLAGRVPLILDAGPCAAGLESSILAITDGTATLLRQGAIPLEVLQGFAGGRIAVTTEGAEVTAPGMTLAHYAPTRPLRLNALRVDEDEFHLGFGAVSGDVSLSERGDPVEAASRLFDLLHLSQQSGRARIAVAPVPETGLGAAINDRLRRAAAGSP